MVSEGATVTVLTRFYPEVSRLVCLVLLSSSLLFVGGFNFCSTCTCLSCRRTFSRLEFIRQGCMTALLLPQRGLAPSTLSLTLLLPAMRGGTDDKRYKVNFFIMLILCTKKHWMIPCVVKVWYNSAGCFNMASSREGIYFYKNKPHHPTILASWPCWAENVFARFYRQSSKNPHSHLP